MYSVLLYVLVLCLVFLVVVRRGTGLRAAARRDHLDVARGKSTAALHVFGMRLLAFVRLIGLRQAPGLRGHGVRFAELSGHLDLMANMISDARTERRGWDHFRLYLLALGGPDEIAPGIGVRGHQ